MSKIMIYFLTHAFNESLFSQITYADEQKCLHKCSLAWNTFAWMAYGRKAVLTSGLLYSEGGLLCWSWGHAYNKIGIDCTLIQVI